MNSNSLKEINKITDKLFVTQITDTPKATSAHNDILGDIRWVGNKCYKYSLFIKGAITAVLGHAVNYIATTGYALNKVTFASLIKLIA